MFMMPVVRKHYSIGSLHIDITDYFIAPLIHKKIIHMPSVNLCLIPLQVFCQIILSYYRGKSQKVIKFPQKRKKEILVMLYWHRF